jgi:putative transposase
MTERARLVSPKCNALSVRKQCELLCVNRSQIYYKPVDEKPENLKIMRIMDEHILKYPAEGVMSNYCMLRELGYGVNVKRVRRLLRLMGHMAVYPKRNLSKLGQAKYIRPYLLRNLAIERANQVWSIDITYIPMAKGFMYCTAIIDVYSRKIMSWEISNTLSVNCCLNALQEAVHNHGKPEIVNSDQGSQFTSYQWISMLDKMNVQISMDGKGRATDNRWIERFWRTLKYKYIYLNPPTDGIELYAGVANYINYYNTKRVHHTTKQVPEKRYLKSIKIAA